MIWGHPHFTTPPSIIIIQHDHGSLEIPTYSFKSIIADCRSVKSSSYASMSYDKHPRPVFQVVSKSPVASCFNFRMKSHFLGSDHKPRDQGHSPRGPRFQGWYAFVSPLDASDVPDPGPSGHEGGAAQWPACTRIPWRRQGGIAGCFHGDVTIFDHRTWRFYVQKLGFKHQKWVIELSTMVEPWTIWILPREHYGMMWK